MPKGGASSLTPVYAGLREDLDGFLKAFLKLKTVRYSAYKNLFKSFEMGQLFSGRSSSAEIIEFNEYILMYCLPYMEESVCGQSPRTFEEQLFGLYSLYTFFYLQEVDHVVKIRVDPDAAKNFRRLMNMALEENVYEAYMGGLKLLEDRAFKFVAFIQVYDPSCFKRFYTDKEVSSMTLRTNLNDPLSAVKELVNSRSFSLLNTVHQQYLERRKLIELEDKKKFPALKNLQLEAKGIIMQKELDAEQISGVEVIVNTDYSIEHADTRGKLRSEIKEKAYGSDLLFTKSRRHRTTPLTSTADSKGSGSKKYVMTRKAHKKMCIALSKRSGHGLFLLEACEKDEFIAEYVGELISEEEIERRDAICDRNDCSYLITLPNGDIDGNNSRFANNCEQNATMYAKTMMVSGEHRIEFYATKSLQVNEELTFDYSASTEHKKASKRAAVPLNLDDVKPTRKRASK